MKIGRLILLIMTLAFTRCDDMFYNQLEIAENGRIHYLTYIHIESNNANTSYAVAGNQIILTFRSPESLYVFPNVLIAGMSPMQYTSLNADMTLFQATADVSTSTTEGRVTFSITGISTMGDMGMNYQQDENTTTDDSYVFFNVLNIIYNGNGNTQGIVPVDTTSYAPNDTPTVLDVFSYGLSKIKNGITLYSPGWNTRADGTGNLYIPGQLITITDKDITLYVHWTVIGGWGPAGGRVFYDKGYYSDAWRYLEVSSSIYEVSGYTWGPTPDIAGALYNAAGYGEENTFNIMEWAFVSGGTYPAADYCDNQIVPYQGNDYDDWFLSSYYDFYLIRDNLQYQGIEIFNTDYPYWSSTEIEFNSSDAYAFDFSTGTIVQLSKTTSCRVRPVRRF